MSDGHTPEFNPEEERIVSARKVRRSLPQSKRVRFYAAWEAAGSPPEVRYSFKETSHGVEVHFPDLDLSFSGKGSTKIARAILSGLRSERRDIDKRLHDLREKMDFPQLGMSLNADEDDELSPGEWARAWQPVRREKATTPHVDLEGWTEFTPLSCLARKDALVRWIEGYAKRAVREGNEQDVAFSTSARKALRRAEVLMWRSDIFDQARHKAEAFVGATFQTEWLPAEPMLWLFQRPWYLDKTDAEVCGPGFEGMVVGQLVYREGDAMLSAIMGAVVSDRIRDTDSGLPHHGQAAILELNVPVGELVGAYPSALHRTICAAEFLKQKVVRRSQQNAPKSAQRAAKKKGVTLPSVSVVHLRRAEYVAPGSNGRGTSDPKEDRYSRRWIVRSFPRRQWYPSRKEHRVVWVKEHVKGPADKPLIVRPVIYRADR